MGNCILYSWNTCSTGNSTAHFLYIDLPVYLQERRKEYYLCAAPEHSQLPLKPCSVLGRSEPLTFLLNCFKVPGFSIHQAHLVARYKADGCILLSQTCLSPLRSLPSSFCRGLKAAHPERAASERCSQCGIQQTLPRRQLVSAGRGTRALWPVLALTGTPGTV